MITPKSQKEALEKLLGRIREAEFWGNVVLQIRKGDIVMTRLEQTTPFEEFTSGDTVPLVILERSDGKTG